jgi:4-alpha-glucanotransferase
MNIPGTMGGNWQWRFSWDMLNQENSDAIKHAIQHAKRANKWH